MILEYFIKEKEIFVKCSDKIIKKSILPKKEGEQVVRISNDSNVYDLLLYLMGIIKNITMEVNNRNTLISQNAFPIFTKILTVILNDTTILYFLFLDVLLNLLFLGRKRFLRFLCKSLEF